MKTNSQIFLNKSSVVDPVSYSGVIIEKVASGFIIKGYDYDEPTLNISPN